MTGQLYSGMWLPLSWEEKNHIAKKFNIPRNGASHVVNNRIQSDGYLEEDLNTVNVEVLQKELGSDESDFFKLWALFLEKIKVELTPVVSPAKEEEKPQEISINVSINKDGDISDTKVVANKKKTNAKKNETVEDTSKGE